MGGHRRLLPDAQSPHRAKVAYAHRQAVNSVVQGTAADIIKLAMLLVERHCCEAYPPGAATLVLQVHDE